MHSKYRHYSFDLWKTLLLSHPEFKQKRAVYFFEHCNPKHKTQAEVTATFLRIDYANTAICEQTGLNVAPELLYAQVLMSLCDADLTDFYTFDIAALKVQMNDLFRANPPRLIHPDVPIRLAELAKTATLSILSNTGYAEGPVLRPILDALGIGQLFQFQIYSDEVGCSKPSSEMFEHLWQGAKSLKPDITPGQIAHIGDNPLADVLGAERAQMIGIHAPDGVVPSLVID
jgi:putative hydrolase of the HAD superfamily